MKEFLPLGSIVQLRDGLKKIMICGRLQKQVNSDKVWDYSACLYPEGIIDPQQMYLFDNDSIDRIYYVGMQDTEEFDFKRYLVEESASESAEQEERE